MIVVDSLMQHRMPWQTKEMPVLCVLVNLAPIIFQTWNKLLFAILDNNNTQIAAVALPPSTTHPLPWAEPHTQHMHTHKLAPNCMLYTLSDLPYLSNLPLLCRSTPVTPPDPQPRTGTEDD